MKIDIDWLAFYICVGVSLFLGLLNKPFFIVLLVAFILLLIQIFTMPTCLYNKGRGFIDKPIFKTYSIKDCIEQYILDFTICSILYLTGYGFNKFFYDINEIFF